jgi:exopolysaccharide production protein ExoQ
MPPRIAIGVFGLGILVLFLLDRDRKDRVSPALWIPVAWVLLAGSRMVSAWLDPVAVETADQVLEGNPLNRLVLTGLVAAGVMVLLARGRRTAAFVRANGPIALFFLYCAVSILWSDYPDVAFKRWIRAVGDIVMILVVVTEADPSAAVKRLLVRSGFLLIPISVLFIKYYPELGRQYSPWTWTTYYTGVATGKNSLGYLCLVFGLASFWRVCEALWGRASGRRRGPLIAHGTVLAMVLWLFWKADSATSLGCFLVGSGLIAVMSLSPLARRPASVHLLVGALLLLSVFALFFEGGSDVVEAMGRDTTLTGRTMIWGQVLDMSAEPLFGTGFESFWLGERLQKFWRIYWWHPNQAHNGYLEVFLNLGWTGLGLLGLVLVWGYRNVIDASQRDPETGRLRVAFFVVAVIYNVTEAAFKGLHPVWIVCLLAIVVVPQLSHRKDG